jgi:hypothetical protein
MAYTNIDDPSAYFQAILYSGNGGTQSITNDGNSDLQPDLVWIKSRSNASWHSLQDSTRGATKTLFSNTNNAEVTYTNAQTSFDSDGFSLAADSSGGSVNVNSRTYVGWQWKANGGTTASNTDGDITSTVQANTDAGFSIVTYTGNTSNNQTVGHGLGVKPSVILIRNRTRVEDWRLNHQGMNNGTGMIRLNSTDTYNTTGTTLMNVAPTSSVFSVSTDWSVNGNYPFVAYCWAEKQGFSKFGTYITNGAAGNSYSTGLANGPFIYTGFKPAFFMVKNNRAGQNWLMVDAARDPVNLNASTNYKGLLANSSATEASGGDFEVNFLSNGIKIFTEGTGWFNMYAGDEYLYMAFAENPFVTSTGVPTTAR